MNFIFRALLNATYDAGMGANIIIKYICDNERNIVSRISVLVALLMAKYVCGFVLLVGCQFVYYFFVDTESVEWNMDPILTMVIGTIYILTPWLVFRLMWRLNSKKL